MRVGLTSLAKLNHPPSPSWLMMPAEIHLGNGFDDAGLPQIPVTPVLA